MWLGRLLGINVFVDISSVIYGETRALIFCSNQKIFGNTIKRNIYFVFSLSFHQSRDCERWVIYIWWFFCDLHTLIFIARWLRRALILFIQTLALYKWFTYLLTYLLIILIMIILFCQKIFLWLISTFCINLYHNLENRHEYQQKPYDAVQESMLIIFRKMVQKS